MPSKLTQKEFEEKFYAIFNNEEWKIVGEYINTKTTIDILHIPCGHIISSYTPNYLLTKKVCCCPICDTKSPKLIPYVNDLATTNPKLAALLANPEDGHKYKQQSNKRVWFKCPYCGELQYKQICEVFAIGFTCKCCSDKISYPEKFFIDLLNQLKIDYIFQYSPDWSHPYHYDFYFSLNDNAYIVELDGGIGHGNNIIDQNIDYDPLARDMLKDKMAYEHNINIIRVDCNYIDISKRFEYIKNAIITSELKNIIDLENVDFLACHASGISKYVEYVSKLWNNGIHGYDNLKEYIPVDRSTLRRYLYDASSIGLIHQTYDEILKINRKYSNKNIQKTKGTAVMCNETGDIFDSMSLAEQTYKIHNLSRYFIKHDGYCGILSDGTKLTWQKLSDKL